MQLARAKSFPEGKGPGQHRYEITGDNWTPFWDMGISFTRPFSHSKAEVAYHLVVLTVSQRIKVRFCL